MFNSKIGDNKVYLSKCILYLYALYENKFKLKKFFNKKNIYILLGIFLFSQYIYFQKY